MKLQYETKDNKLSNIDPCPQCKKFFQLGYKEGQSNLLITQKLVQEHEINTNIEMIINKDQILIGELKTKETK